LPPAGLKNRPVSNNNRFFTNLYKHPKQIIDFKSELDLSTHCRGGGEALGKSLSGLPSEEK